MSYQPKKIENRWRRIWRKIGICKTPERSKKPRKYVLDFFPYPSGHALHVGHPRGYVGSDIIARYLRMNGYNVLHPMGFDAFGLPAENAAIKHKVHPRDWTYGNIKRMRKQLKSIGTCYDWDREIITCDPQYYKWTQWMFLQFFKRGLAKRAKVPANWCPSCKTVLANEQVIEGKCERCGTTVIQKELEQWIFKITDYAEMLLKGLEDLDWPETTKTMQRNWIGKSEGWEVKFPISIKQPNQHQSVSIKVFTTRVDTLFGATYLVVAPEHPIIKNLKPEISNFKSVDDYIAGVKRKTELERIAEVKQKTGIEVKGIKAINPATSEKISIWVADYVLMRYGTGAIMGVPAHDQRDFDFAQRFNLPIREVIAVPNEQKQKLGPHKRIKQAYEGEGILINSGMFNGTRSELAKREIGKWLAKRGQASSKVYYHLRDWIISRQRYWGCPIPIVFCQKCGWIPVPEKELPVMLPKISDYQPTEKGQSPLARSKKFIETICPICGRKAKRETDTMDTFVCSSWYYLRFVDNRNKTRFASKQKIRKWLPVDIYVGGAEHAVMHLLYARFFSMALSDMGFLDFKEPFIKLRHPGMVLAPDGKKMSKSKGNVINPDAIIEKYGIDTLRLYEMFMGPFSETTKWDIHGIEGCFRFLQHLFKVADKVRKSIPAKTTQQQNRYGKCQSLLHATIKKVTEDIEGFKFNTAIAAMMKYLNKLVEYRIYNLELVKPFILILAPFAPYTAEHLWWRLKKIVGTKQNLSGFKKQDSIFEQKWPKYDSRLIKKKVFTLIIEVNARVRDKIVVEVGISASEAERLAKRQKRVIKWIKGKKIKKAIFVPNKLINFVY